MKKKDLLLRKDIMITTGCALLLTLFCMIMILMPNRTYCYQGGRVFDNGVAETEAIVYEKIALPPGVYDIILEYQTDTSLNSLCSVKDGTVYTGGLLTNWEILHKNLNHTNYHIWLFEGTEELQVNISYGGAGYVITGNLTIRETNLLWTILLVIIWTAAFGINALLAFRHYDQTVGVKKEKKNIIVGLSAIVLLASLPFMQEGILSGGDLGYHLQRIEGVKDGIISGQFPVRLEPEWLYGHGYANGVFYCNTLLYIPAFFRWMGFTVGTSYKIFAIILNIATAGIAYYCFGRIFKNGYIGLLCSALHTLSIYRLYKFAICGAVGESSAFLFLPMILYGFYRCFSEDAGSRTYKTAWIPLAVGYAGILQTHVLTCEITAFLTIIVCIIFVKKIFVRETFLALLKGAMAAMAMSFWYLVPFLDYYLNEDVHIHHVSARRIQSNGTYLAQLFFHWWRSGDNSSPGDQGMTGSQAMGIGLVLGIGFLIFCILWFSGKWKTKEEAAEAKRKEGKIIFLGKISCILGALFLVMSLNIFPWDRLQELNPLAASLISSIQYPDRFIGWATIFLVCLWGCLLWFFRENNKWRYYLGIICIFIGITTSSMYLTDFVCRDTSEVYLYNEEGMGCGYISGAEYLIEGTRQELLDFAVPVSSSNVQIAEYDKRYLHMWVTCANHGQDAGYVDMPLLHYTGYRAFDTATGKEMEVMRGTNNLVRVLVPVGFQGKMEVKFVSPVYWRISEAVTYLWWIFVAAMCVRNLKSKSRKAKVYADGMMESEMKYE